MHSHKVFHQTHFNMLCYALLLRYVFSPCAQSKTKVSPAGRTFSVWRRQVSITAASPPAVVQLWRDGRRDRISEKRPDIEYFSISVKKTIKTVAKNQRSVTPGRTHSSMYLEKLSQIPGGDRFLLFRRFKFFI